MKRIFMLSLFFLLLFMAACNPAGGTQVATVGNLEPEAEVVAESTDAPAVSEDEATADPATCPEATADLALLQDPAHGFCLLYPADYQVVAGENNVGLVKDSLLNVSDPRLGITIEEAGERTATVIADAVMVDFPADIWPDITRSTISVAGVEAEVLNNLPGQDLNRRVVLVHEGLLYDMLFSPLDDADKSTEGRLELFYNDIVDSFQFMPVVADAPLQAGPECPEATADTQLYRNETDGYCLLIPADFIAEETEAGKSVVYFGSLMDVEHAKLFINVTEADGRSLSEIGDELVAGLEDFGVERSFGLLVDGEWADLISKMPGQDINRQVIFMHNGRLFTLTFVPDDAAAGEAYEQMEAMYELALSSFNFLQQ
jgi:hypothetical protein